MSEHLLIAFDRAVDRLARWQHNRNIAWSSDGRPSSPVDWAHVPAETKRDLIAAAAKILREITVEVPDAD